MLKAAVIGVGYLGQFHAQKIAESKQAELVAVCDTDFERAKEIAEKYNTTAYDNYHAILDQVDCVNIVTPTRSHFNVSRDCLRKGIHTLIEKPITTTILEAEELICLANKHHCILQVGHLERFNNAVKAISPYITTPRFIESTRLAPFKLRGSDVNVILDLMIHDIDIIHSIINEDITDIRATGARAISDSIDIANARIEFKNGCIANVSASRISLHTERKLQIFCQEHYITADLNRKKITLHKKGNNEIHPGIQAIVKDTNRFEQGDALKEQIEAFLHSIQTRTPPLVTGEDGKHALLTAITITRLIEQHNEKHPHLQACYDD